MSWFSSDYQRRHIVSIDHFAGGGGSPSTIFVQITIPKTWQFFWTKIRSDFKDVVLTDGAGQVLTYQRGTGSNYATQDLILQVKDFAAPHDDSVNAIFLYYFFAGETSDRSSSFSMPGSFRNGYILLERPYNRIVPANVGSTSNNQPITSFMKMTGEIIDVFYLTQTFLGERLQSYNERLNLEEISHAFIRVFNQDGTASSTLAAENSQMRLGNGFIRARFKLGTDDNNYAISLVLVTDDGQTIESRAIMRIKDLLPTS